MRINIPALLFLFLIVFSCHKKAVNKHAKEFIGNWRHVENSNERWYIEIGSNGWGTITLYDSLNNRNDKNHYGENPRKWRLNQSENNLHLGITVAKFSVDTYPTIAQQQLILGLDTIQSGQTYLVLSNMCFRKTN